MELNCSLAQRDRLTKGKIYSENDMKGLIQALDFARFLTQKTRQNTTFPTHLAR
jgi:hypothetical protein